MEPWQLILLALLGILAGTLNVIAGGGSLLTLPAMILMGMPEAVANGTNRVAILAQNITAVSAFRKKGFSDFRLSLSLGLAALPGAIVGAWCGAVIRGDLFNKILAGVMIGVVIWMALKGRKKATSEGKPEEESKPSGARIIVGHLCIFGVGFYGGFIQAGVGFLLMAALHGVLGLDLVRVNMHKVFVVGVFTVAALIVFLVAGKVWWIPGLVLAVGNSLGGWIGSHLTISRGEGFIRGVLYVALIAMAIKLVIG
ncbi:MAG: sulfite exporter TauE/SafE family protein [Verrucomicrobiales bacterium]|nr:sulfite exporter TauE/SafE family protein [Verrucomicrobiales bacterium]